jgi:hypothetical protein
MTRKQIIVAAIDIARGYLDKAQEAVEADDTFHCRLYLRLVGMSILSLMMDTLIMQRDPL